MQQADDIYGLARFRWIGYGSNAMMERTKAKQAYWPTPLCISIIDSSMSSVCLFVLLHAAFLHALVVHIGVL